ncbi:hypothetical protein GU927_018220 [Rhodobacteraceae bacterium HSP-20]|uniref:YtkA-like domain-containing protein n=1 Tax=Paragemmobacter amnigenus TaxID=2852097 RepID=A0ABS6J940_9RHOB|nr:hypothetical protein [Rhodobacter amnigenus]MBU9699781.1 hypothetical protein [Rhodobacter amnigenus]MBV4391008.1 hypothetical protein [Rhodobacter amnigenus]
MGVAVFVGVFIWTTVWTLDPRDTISADPSVTAEVSEAFSDGRMDVQVYALGGRDVRVEIQFMPDTDAGAAAGMRPVVNFAMVDMHMDGIAPPLQLVEAGVWRADVELPMAGRWVVSVGFGEEFAEVEFDAR